MPRTFYLKGKCEVALAEIQYPHTWEALTGQLVQEVAGRIEYNKRRKPKKRVSKRNNVKRAAAKYIFIQ